jgi:hypothetical protein
VRCVAWRNSKKKGDFDGRVSPLTAVDYYVEFYNNEVGAKQDLANLKEFTLIMGDESGMVKIQDLTYLLEQNPTLEGVDLVTGNSKRNPHRVMQVEKYTLDEHEQYGDVGSEDGVADMLKQGEGPKGEPKEEQQQSSTFKTEVNLHAGSSKAEERRPEQNDQIRNPIEWSAHKDSVKAIQYVHSTDRPLVFTAGLDRMAYIWDRNMKEDKDNKKDDQKERCQGKLVQGYMMRPHYQWNFPMTSYESKRGERQEKTEKELQDCRR